MKRPGSRWLIVVLLLVGLALRLAPPTGYSDVLAVTEAAIREMLAMDAVNGVWVVKLPAPGEFPPWMGG